MSRRSLRPLAALAVIGAVLVAPACGDDDDDDAGPGPTSSSADPQNGPSDVSERVAAVQGALLTADEVGPGFVDTGYDLPDPDTPSPCGTPSVPKQYPDAVRLGADFQRGQDLSLVEGVTVLKDVETATEAYRLGVTGLSCDNPSLENQPVTIGEAQDVSSDIGGDEAQAWRISGAGVQGALVAVQIDEIIVTLTFLAPEGTDTTNAPDSVAIAKTAIAKLENA